MRKRAQTKSMRKLNYTVILEKYTVFPGRLFPAVKVTVKVLHIERWQGIWMKRLMDFLVFRLSWLSSNGPTIILRIFDL